MTWRLVVLLQHIVLVSGPEKRLPLPVAVEEVHEVLLRLTDPVVDPVELLRLDLVSMSHLCKELALVPAVQDPRAHAVFLTTLAREAVLLGPAE